MTQAQGCPPVISDAQRAAVEARLARPDLSRRERERLEMVKAAALGYDLSAIVRWSGRSEVTVQYWLERFGRGGVEALVDAPRAGRPPKADAAYRTALAQAVTTPPPTLGLPFDVWTSTRLSAYLEECTGVRIAPGWLRALLASQRFTCGRPKHTLTHLQDADEVAACAATLAAAEKKSGRRPRSVRAALSR